MMFDNFDRVRIINLPHRADRRREMTAELERIGLTVDGVRIAFFEACSTQDDGGFYSKGAYGCYLSHLTILEGGGSVLILEDDCDFTPTVRDYEFGDSDIFYGGYYAKNPDDLQNSDIIGAHMMGYSEKAASIAAVYLRQLLDPEFRDFVPPPPIDGALVWLRRKYPDLSTKFAVPPLAFQRPSRTDIGDLKMIDRVPWMQSAVHLARRIKRRIIRA